MADVTLYTSTPCGFCSRAKRLLDRKGVDYDEVRVPLWKPGAREKLVELTGRFTVPQIVVDDRPIGGWDELHALDRAGELDALLGVA